MTSAPSAAETAREIRKDVVRMISLTGRGGLGISLALADLLTWLYWSYLRVDPRNPRGEDRDRLVLGTGAGAPALYATLARRGYFSREELWNFSRLGAILQGVPARLSIPGVDAPLAERGRALGVGCGMALGLRRKGSPRRVVCLLDGAAWQEGLFWEGVRRCGAWGMGGVTAVVASSSEGISSAWSPSEAESALVQRGWRVLRTTGHCVDTLSREVEDIERKGTSEPLAVLAETTLGRGVRLEGERDERFHHEGRPWDRGVLGETLREIDGKKEGDSGAPFVF